VAVHDRYGNYFHRRWENLAGHQACNSHLLRDFADADKAYPDQHWPAQAQRAEDQTTDLNAYGWHSHGLGVPPVTATLGGSELAVTDPLHKGHPLRSGESEVWPGGTCQVK
jgi:hypothetical protein